MDVDIKFWPRWQQQMLDGVKTHTCRTRKMGEPGDTFYTYGATFVLVEVKKIQLCTVALDYYTVEGCKSPEEFMEVWKQLHPRSGWVPDQMVWLHRFEKIHGGVHGT